jgi:hypothetical protein
MQLFGRVSLYSGLASLAVSAVLFGFTEVARNEIREEETRYDAKHEALARGGATFEQRAAARDEHEAAMRPKQRFRGWLEISGLVALMAGLVLAVVGALVSGAKRSKPRKDDPFAGREDEDW